MLDPIDGLISRTDTSLAVIDKAREKGIDVDTATIEQLYYENRACAVVSDAERNEKSAPLADYDLIFMRKEPPYDLRFHYATQLLSQSGTLVLNSPAALRSFNEKLIVLPFTRYMPPTLVASNRAVIAEFAARHEQIVIKSLDSFQGKSVRRISANDTGVISDFTEGGSKPVMAQKFLEQVFDGDKRVIALGDRVLGAALRRPKQGYHANFANSDALKSGLSDREQAIMDEVGPWMVSQGIHFSGLDFIGGYLTEINITCPTGIVQISALEGRDLAAEIVDYFVALV